MRIFGSRIGKPSQKWAFFRWYDIILDGELYLSRLNLIKTPWFSVKLHWIHRPDADRHMHTHPWHFMSFVLRGGYKELESKYPDKKPGKLRAVNWFNYKNIITAHRITEARPRTLTLIFSGPKIRSWGFYNCNTFEYADWRDYEERDLAHQWD